VQSLELVALLPILTLIILAAWQGIVVARLGAEADADARTLARITVLCPTPKPPTLSSVDPAAKAGQVDVGRMPESLIAITVSLPIPAVIPGLDLRRWGPVRSTVTMRQEPCT